MLPDLLGPDAEPIDLEFTAPDGTNCNDAPLVLVSNNPYELTHLSGAGTRERIDTGTLGIVAARVRSTRRLQARRARAGRPGGALPRPAVLVRAGVRGPLGEPCGDRPRRRGARARPAVALRVAARARCACGCPAAPACHRRRARWRSRRTTWARCFAWPPAGEPSGRAARARPGRLRARRLGVSGSCGRRSSDPQT